MSLESFAVRRSVTTSMLLLAMVIMGVVGLVMLQMDALPDIEPPVVSVVTFYPGATALDIETEVTKRLEDKLSSVPNLDTLNSTSKDNLSLVALKYDWGTDLADASNDIRDRIGQIRRELPDDIEEPVIFKFNSADFPVMIAAVSARESYRDLYRITDKQIVDQLRRVPGVGEVMIRGGLRRQINVYIDRTQLERLNISPAQVEQALARENVNMPAGELKHGFTQVKVRVPGRFENVDDIRSVVLGAFNGSLVTLGDVATVEDSFVEPTEYVWADGRNAVVLIIRKQSGQNTPEVCRRLHEAFARIQPRLPADVRINALIDNSEAILNNISNLSRTLLYGGLLVVVITYLFLMRVRSSLIVVITIPVSLISTFCAMYVCGYTINIVSLISLTIAVGMVVDNAIVVLESITRHLDRHDNPRTAAVSGAREVSLAIFASTLTTVVVFMPLIFTTGLTGIIFKQLAVIISLTLLISWFVSVTLTPLMASRLLHAGSAAAGRLAGWQRRWLSAFGALERAYGWLLQRALRHRPMTVFIAVIIFGGSLPLVKFIGTEFTPEVDSGEVRVTIEYDENTRLEETARIAAVVNAYQTEQIPESKGTYLVVGESDRGFASAAGQREGPNVASGGPRLVRRELRERSAKDVAAAMRAFLARQPGVKRLSVSSMGFMQQLFGGGAAGKPVVVEVQGPDLDDLIDVSSQLAQHMRTLPGCVDVAVQRPEFRREVWVQVDRARAAALGVTIATIGETVRSLFYGADATEFLDGGENFDVHLRLPPSQRVTREDILDVTVPSTLPGAPPVKLANLARVEEHPGPIEIKRKNRERIVTIEADTYKRSLGEITADISSMLATMPLPLGVTVAFGGDTEEQQKSFRTLLYLFILGFVLVYMVMAGQFESYLDPFVIIFAVPFALTGAIWFVLLTGNRINLMSFIGVIMLLGIVVNNGIVLVDYTNQLRHSGMELFAAVREACVTRLRPVLMTTLTTVIGLTPMAFSTGEGAESWRPLGATVIGGLAVSTLVTLVLVPVLYTLFERRRQL